MPQSTTTKTRTRGLVTNPGTVNHQFVFPVPAVWQDFDNGYAITTSGTYETCTSVGHRGPPFNEGGPFSVKRFQFERQSVPFSKRIRHITTPPLVAYTDYRVDGDVFLRPDTNGGTGMVDGLNRIVTKDDLFTKYGLMSFPSRDLNAYGTSAIRRFSPLKPGVDLGQDLGELLKDGLPNLPVKLLKQLRDFTKSNPGFGPKAARFSAAGSKDFLAYTFGWAPLLSDLRSMYRTWVTLDARLRQLVRDNGRPIRRSGELYNTITTTSSPIAQVNRFNSPAVSGLWSNDSSLNGLGAGTPGGTMTTTISERIWFEGRFRYYLPLEFSNLWSAKTKLVLFGLYPSPSLLYELIPWTWLVNWFVNIGDVLANISGNGLGELIVDYAYVMRHYEKVTTYSIVSQGCQPSAALANTGSREPFYPTQFSHVKREELKERVVSTPFGFGITFASLSARQAAILAALNLSRVNF